MESKMNNQSLKNLKNTLGAMREIVSLLNIDINNLIISDKFEYKASRQTSCEIEELRSILGSLTEILRKKCDISLDECDNETTTLHNRMIASFDEQSKDWKILARKWIEE